MPLALNSREASLSFQSQTTQTHLLELFTSEGCHSCPPADRWFGTFQESDDLWKTVVPVAFHVDYWDYIGWKDPFAKAAYTRRQRTYAFVSGAKSVYTPGFFLNGEEWRQFFGLRKLPTPSDKKVGVLKGRWVQPNQVWLEFNPIDQKTTTWVAHAAFLGVGLSSNVKRGENRGKKLEHFFVALDHKNRSMKKEKNGYVADIELEANAPMNPKKTAVAIWITKKGEVKPIQAAGRYLP